VTVVCAGNAEARGDRERERCEAAGSQIDRERFLETLDGLRGCDTRVGHAEVETVHEPDVRGLVQPAHDQLVWPDGAALVRRRGAGECDEARHDD
jgi:hypothetical protein